MENLGRREREKLNRRNEILQAARTVFASKDYDSATIDDIAATAELSKGTIYLYFQNKADLFLSTCEASMERINTITIEAISSSDDPETGIRNVIKRQLDFVEENIDFFKILSSERAHFEIHSEIANNSVFKERIISTFNRSINAIAEHIQKGIDMGVFKPINPRDASSALQSIIRDFAFRLIMEHEDIKLSEKHEVISTIFMNGLNKD